jgi:cytochrome c biogenesis protein CcdA/glutaredoxin
MKKYIKNFSVLIFSAIILLSPFFSFAQTEAPVETPVFKTNLIYFYSNTCSHCQRIKPFINDLEKRYKEKIDFKRYEISESEANRILFYKFLDTYGTPSGEGGVPAVFIGEINIMGDVPIEQYLEGKIGECVLNTCKLENGLDDVVGGLKEVQPVNRGKLSIALVAGAALVDSINPCAIAVLLFLIAFLLAIKMPKKRMLLIGGIYIFTVMVVYISAGFGLLRFIGYFNLGRAVNYFAAAMLIFAGLLSVKDFWWYGKGISLKIPDHIKPRIEKYLTNATIPSVILAGILVSAFELPCTGEVYLGILSLMSKEATFSASVFYLILYNVIFVLPLVIILLFSAAGLNIERIEQIRFERRRWLRLLLGIGMIILAIWLLA